MNFLLAAMVGPLSSSSVASGLMYRTGSISCHERPRNAKPRIKLAGK